MLKTHAYTQKVSIGTWNGSWIFVHLYGILNRNSRQFVKSFCWNSSIDILLFSLWNLLVLLLLPFPVFRVLCVLFCFFLHRLLRAVRIYNSVWFTLLHSHKLVIHYASLSLCRSHSVRFPFQRYQLAHWVFTFTSIDSNFDKCELDSESTLIIPAT